MGRCTAVGLPCFRTSRFRGTSAVSRGAQSYHLSAGCRACCRSQRQAATTEPQLGAPALRIQGTLNLMISSHPLSWSSNTEERAREPRLRMVRLLSAQGQAVAGLYLCPIPLSTAKRGGIAAKARPKRSAMLAFGSAPKAWRAGCAVRNHRRWLRPGRRHLRTRGVPPDDVQHTCCEETHALRPGSSKDVAHTAHRVGLRPRLHTPPQWPQPVWSTARGVSVGSPVSSRATSQRQPASPPALWRPPPHGTRAQALAQANENGDAATAGQ
mmetsp:Transcript_23478/g.65275  ORF Transcript_23478/g.65275 Transcript_23478/m.65275 type:complete len:269 (+) Transcript_23478:98-904(+)